MIEDRPAYSWQDALKQRLAAIQDLSNSRTTWENFQQQKRMLNSQQSQRMSGLQSQLAGMQDASPGNYTGPRGSDDFERFKNAIASIESGGNYNARNPSGALGKYQIMSGNVPSWSRAALGYSVSPQQFLASPEIQEKVGTYYLQQYYNKYGAAGAAVAWYAGEGTAQKWLKASGGSTYNRGQAGGYPSINAYVQKLYARMGR